MKNELFYFSKKANKCAPVTDIPTFVADPRGSAAEKRHAPLEAPPGRRGGSGRLAASAGGDVVEAAEAQETLQAAEQGRMHPKARVEKEAARMEDTAGRCARAK